MGELYKRIYMTFWSKEHIGDMKKAGDIGPLTVIILYTTQRTYAVIESLEISFYPVWLCRK